MIKLILKTKYSNQTLKDKGITDLKKNMQKRAAFKIRGFKICLVQKRINKK